MTTEQRQNRITVGFILLSLLLHLLLLAVPKHKLFPAEPTPKPVYVEVRPPQEREKSREIDLPIRPELEKPRQQPAKRLAEKDQVVEREQAPTGQDSEDSKRVSRTPKTVQKPTLQPVQTPEEHTQQNRDKAVPVPITPQGWRSTEQVKPKPKLPDLQTLTQISPEALSQIESDWRRKYRAEIEKGDTVWMDTEQDLLYSFMKRFRDQVYNVWNYPDSSIMREQQGTCLLRITVDRQGNVLGVELLESSGFKALDEEAMEAVRQGASYGPLPRAYPNEGLKIMAFFEYRLGGVMKRSYRRPGDIY